jgi:alkylation response protein AidB-like acyl-CoA dehydrogenase
MSAPSTSAAEAAELARSLDDSLAKILPGGLLLNAAEHDTAPGDATQQDLLGLGWTGIAVPEEAGGLGLDDATLVKLAAVAGRRLLPAALRGEAFVLAPALARLAADEPRAADLLGSLLAGEMRGGGGGGGGPPALV